MTTLLRYAYAGERALRLDRVLLEAAASVPELKDVSRAQLQHWIAAGAVVVDKKPRLKPGWLVQPGSEIQIIPPQKAPADITPSGRDLEILYEDPILMVVNKPAGLSMHPGAGRAEDTLVHAVAGKLSPEELARGERPGIVHRLDMDTTGIVVVAKTSKAHFALSRQFSSRTVGREYLALVYTTPRGNRAVSRDDEGTVTTQLGRHPKKRQEMAVLSTGGKTAVTHWKVLERMKQATLLAVRLETGRTHQIRVHMAHIGSPVIGDQVYGDFSGLPAPLKVAAEKFGRQALHARLLEFSHPETAQRLKFEEDPPGDMLMLAETFRRYGV